MRSVNRATLLGNVGRDPEVKFTGGGTAVASFSLATSERYKDKSGEWQDRSEWHNLVAYGRTAEVIRDYVSKGSKLYVEGRIQTRSWDGNDGKKQYRTEIVIDEVIMVGAKGEPKSDSGPRQQSSYNHAEIQDDDIPF